MTISHLLMVIYTNHNAFSYWMALSQEWEKSSSLILEGSDTFTCILLIFMHKSICTFDFVSSIERSTILLMMVPNRSISLICLFLVVDCCAISFWSGVGIWWKLKIIVNSDIERSHLRLLNLSSVLDHSISLHGLFVFFFSANEQIVL